MLSVLARRTPKPWGAGSCPRPSSNNASALDADAPADLVTALRELGRSGAVEVPAVMAFHALKYPVIALIASSLE